MFGWLKSLGSSDPQAKLKKAKDKKYDEAIRFQRRRPAQLRPLDDRD